MKKELLTAHRERCVFVPTLLPAPAISRFVWVHKSNGRSQTATDNDKFMAVGSPFNTKSFKRPKNCCSYMEAIFFYYVTKLNNVLLAHLFAKQCSSPKRREIWMRSRKTVISLSWNKRTLQRLTFKQPRWFRRFRQEYANIFFAPERGLAHSCSHIIYKFLTGQWRRQCSNDTQHHHIWLSISRSPSAVY